MGGPTKPGITFEQSHQRHVDNALRQCRDLLAVAGNRPVHWCAPMERVAYAAWVCLNAHLVSEAIHVGAALVLKARGIAVPRPRLWGDGRFQEFLIGLSFLTAAR